MTTAITIRQLPMEAKQKLRLRAATNGRSMEAEARAILVNALEEPTRADLTWIQQLIEVGNLVGGVDLPEVPDGPATAADFNRS
ncbi:MAG: Arc family DNA-binding protein [Propionibacteriaceae bacterium]|nr:Arc family DNA-binding protein [Propionibacteriaceae bacterium]